MLLIFIGLVAGIIAGISPCVLPVLPVIFAAGAITAAPLWRRSISIVFGLIVSFTILILAGTEIISALHLPDTFLRDVGIALLLIVGLGFLVPSLGHIVERPFTKLVARTPALTRDGFIIGLALGLVFVPCAGPVLSTVIVLGAKENLSVLTVLVTLAFSVGAAIPLLIIALAGGAITSRSKSLRARAPRLRQIGGAVMVVMAIVIATNVLSSLQTDLPGYTTALQSHVEGSTHIRKDLQSLSGTQSSDGQLASCVPGASKLADCGRAPNFADVTAWLNTKPLTIKGLRGKVVLVDFWTYSCINCERALPHVEAWYNRYKNDGLVVVGVHTPEFAFEHVVSNVKAAAKSLGVDYPIDVDSNYGTWDAYANEYWPADYLIDAQGVIRYDDFGEGNYSTTETLIRQLLTTANPGVKLPPRTDVANLTPTEATSPESYIGYERLEYSDNATRAAHDQPAAYKFPTSTPLGYFSFAGIWTDHSQEATAGENAKIKIDFQARDAYLVLGGTGTLQVSGAGAPPESIPISGVPRLYRLFHATSTTDGTLTLTFTPGLRAYDFTFG